MPSLIDIRRRIRSVKNTQQITKAMKMVSAAKLRRAQERAHRGASVREDAAADAGQRRRSRRPESGCRRTHPLLAVRPEKRILLVVVTADGGLAGGFNSNLIKLAQRFVDEHRAARAELRTDRPQGARLFPATRTRDIAGEHTRSVPQREVRGRGEDRRTRSSTAFSNGEDRRGVPVRERVQERDGLAPGADAAAAD